jgi:hypothetical protein
MKKPTKAEMKAACAKADDRLWRLGLPKLAHHAARQAEINFWMDPRAWQGGGVPWVSLFDRKGDPVRGFEAPPACDGANAQRYLWEFLCRHDPDGRLGCYAMYHFCSRGEPGSLVTLVIDQRECHYLECPIIVVDGGYGLGDWKVTTQVATMAEDN